MQITKIYLQEIVYQIEFLSQYLPRAGESAADGQATNPQFSLCAGCLISGLRCCKAGVTYVR